MSQNQAFRGKIVLILAAVLLFAGLFSAQAKAAGRTEITTLNVQQDLTVMFSFDKENVDITFVSPSGIAFTKNSEEVEFAEGELWSTYRVKNAQPGKWSVEYELGANTEVQYSLLTENYGLFIQYMKQEAVTENNLPISFEADWEDGDIWYRYEIWAVSKSEDQEPVPVESGSAQANKEYSVDVNLRNLDSGEYTLRLDVSYTDDGVEVYDVWTGEPFTFTNPNPIEAIEDFKVFLDMSAHTLRINWKDNALWRAQNYRVVVTDTDEIYNGELPSDITETSVTYPVTATQLQVSLSYQESGRYSEPLTKHISLQGDEYLQTEDVDVTGSAQLVLKYKVVGEKTMTLTINDEETQQLIIKDENILGVNLSQGINTIYAEFEGEDGIIYCLEKTIYQDAYSPSIMLYDMKDGMTLHSDSVDIIGKTEGVTLTANKTAVELKEDGYFEYPYKLSMGENVLELRAEDVNGNASVLVLTLYREADNSGIFHIAAWKQFLPLLISLGVSLVLILFSALFMRRKEKPAEEAATDTETTNQKETAPETRREKKHKSSKGHLAIVVLFLLEIGSIVSFVRITLFNRSVEYLELAEHNIQAAAVYSKLQTGFMIGSIVGLVLCILAAADILIKRKKKKHKAAEETTES